MSSHAQSARVATPFVPYRLKPLPLLSAVSRTGAAARLLLQHSRPSQRVKIPRTGVTRYISAACFDVNRPYCFAAV